MQSLAWHGQGDARVRREPFPRPPGASPQQGLPHPGPRGLYREARLLFLHGLLQELPAPQRALCFLQRLHRGLGQQEALGDTQWEARLRLSASELWYSSAEGLFTLPVYFSSDWLNEYWDTLDVDDYRFIYMGPAGTWSPFHADIFRSFSWSVNICGRKKWFFFPPGHEEALRDCHGGLPYDVTAPEFLDSHLHPVLEVTQEAGEMVFVPSGWHHQVHNLEDTISINHNWVNGCNLANMWHFLQQELCAVQQEVSEWRDTMPDWHHHCQVIMKSCTGINFEEFYQFLKVIAERRLLLVKKIGPGELQCSEDSGLGLQHTIFDISRIAEVLASVVVNPDFQRVDTSRFLPQPEDLLQQLQEALATTEPL
ncbi:PREDICTED: jmjC domain-containing protein 4 isoform X4 [Myotis davidii]|uniref:jmjC domain-containing protein 4 isoform X4 n=1 Tax=Myotis davidii TaxID=225400 RepID=UPI000767A7C1|nr:PREDICTED: jmjC domain-containing protein 4 isoform X4 [Myotis davidii]